MRGVFIEQYQLGYGLGWPPPVLGIMISSIAFLILLSLSTATGHPSHHDPSFLNPRFLSLINGSDPSFTISILNSTKDCTEEILKTSPIAAQRFSELQLAILCRNRQKWTTQAVQRGVWSDPGKLLTKKQHLFLQHFHTCQDLDTCICKNRSCEGIDPHEPIDPLEPMPTPVPLKKPLRGRGQKRKGPRNKRDQPTGGLPKAIRKEYRRLTDEERNRFHVAINRLKSDTVDNLSKYDLLVLYHTPQQAPGAHWGPAFLPWHRELLKQ